MAPRKAMDEAPEPARKRRSKDKCPPGPNSKAGKLRARTFIRVEEKLLKERFKSPALRGIAIGEKSVDYPEKKVQIKGKYHTRKAFNGTVAIWVTRSDSELGSLIFREWPSTYSAPSRYCSDTVMTNFSITLQQVHEQIDKKVKETTAMECAALAHAILPDRGITRTEAVLITQFDECYYQAVRFLKEVGWMEKEDGYQEWGFKSKYEALAMFSRLRYNYGEKFFPSPEAVSITANWIVCYWERWAKLFADNPEFIDRVLFLGSYKLWKTKGTAKNRNIIVEVPIKGNLVPPHKEVLEDCTKINKTIVGTKADLRTLLQISPIANMSIWGTSKSQVAAPNDQKLQPLLSNKHSKPYQGTHFAVWSEHLYDPTQKGLVAGPVPPLTVGPHKLITDVKDHKECADALIALAAELDRFSHWILVVAVWRDYLIPAAQADDVDRIQEFGKKLFVMTAGGLPSELDNHNAQSARWAKDHLDVDEEEEQDEEQDEENVDTLDQTTNVVEAANNGFLEEGEVEDDDAAEVLAGANGENNSDDYESNAGDVDSDDSYN